MTVLVLYFNGFLILIKYTVNVYCIVVFMSIVAFKKKSVIQYGSKRSGKPPGGIWLSSGPFGASSSSVGEFGTVGFSLNGGHRNVGYIGKTYQMSKQGTPFRGQHPCWISGNHKRKSLPVFNSNEVIVLGDQSAYIKPSVLSTRGMLRKRFKWAYNGQYPNYWVQPNYSGNQTDTASQGLYIQNIAVANDCVNDVNDFAKYEGYRSCGGPTLCHTSTALFKFNDMASNAPYTKTLHIPLSSSQQTLRIQRKCANPTGSLKPFPFAVNGGSSNGVASVNGVTGGNSGFCHIQRNVDLAPPAWYVKSNIDNVES